MPPPSRIVVAFTDATASIGAAGGLPWNRFPEDMRRFRELTAGCTLVMGRGTWDSPPRKPLPGRMSLVVSASGAGNCPRLPRPDQVPGLACYVGGERIFSEALDFVDEVHATVVEQEFERCDRYFPRAKLEALFRRAERSDRLYSDAVGGWYRFETWARK